MAVNIFGHGDSSLPAHYAELSHGPDVLQSPGCCRELIGNGPLDPYDDYGYADDDDRTQNCGDPCSDHCCCCDPCRHTQQDVCREGCCRCVPKSICATFLADGVDPPPACVGKTWHLVGELFAGERTNYVFYAGGLGKVTLSVGKPTLDSSLFGYADCTWRLEVPQNGIDWEVEIDHHGAINCLATPEWTIPNASIIYSTGTSSGTLSCTGSISFSSSRSQKVPFEYRWTGVPELSTASGCDGCQEVCTILCVKRGKVAPLNYYDDPEAPRVKLDGYTRDDFTWIEQRSRWEKSSPDEYFILDQDGYTCFLDLEGITGPFANEEITFGICNLGMHVTAVDDNDNFIEISCNPCSCWKYRCGECRCVCKTLCVLGVEDGVIVGPFELAWDPATNIWGDGSGGSPTVELTADSESNCQLKMNIFEDAVPIPNTCGTNLSATFNDPIDTQISSGISRVYFVWCKPCDGRCDTGDCFAACEDEVPQVLYADLTPGDWMAGIGCNDLGADDYGSGYSEGGCFEPVTIPLALVFVAAEGVAGEWRWIGQALITCKHCDQGSNEGEELPSQYLVQIDIGCDGIINFAVRPDGYIDAGLPCVQQFEFILPCGPGAVWDLNFQTDNPCGSIVCCELASFKFGVTE